MPVAEREVRRVVGHRLLGADADGDLREGEALAAAVAMGVDPQAACRAMSQVEEVAGRYSTYEIHGRLARLMLAKNPAGWQEAMYMIDPAVDQVIVAVNGQVADGQDLSWLWDVDFTPLKQAGVSIVTGVRATDMALRLSYDDVAVGKVEADLSQALAQLVKLSREQHRPIRILSTYTAMLELRSLLASYTDVEEVL